MTESSSKWNDLRNPLSVEHLLRVQTLYRELRAERPEILGGLPFSTNWLRFRYLRRDTLRTLALAQFAPDTLALHRDAFDWSNSLLLKGLIHHELLHFVLGYSEGHSKLFRTIEADWSEQDGYLHQRRKCVRALEESARADGRLWKYACPNCHATYLRARPMKPESACSKCCKSLNGGVWSESYSLITVGQPDKGNGENASPVESGDSEANPRSL